MRVYAALGTRAVSNWKKLAVTVPGMSRERLVFAASGLYSQATTPEPRNAPLGFWTCPNSTRGTGARLTVTEVGPLTTTVDSTVGSKTAEVRRSKVASHNVR